MMRVGVILGGISSEREASLASGRQVCVHLNPQKHEAIPLFMDLDGQLWHLPQKLLIQNTTSDIIARLEEEAERVYFEELRSVIDFAFIALHGKYGDDEDNTGEIPEERNPCYATDLLENRQEHAEAHFRQIYEVSARCGSGKGFGDKRGTLLQDCPGPGHNLPIINMQRIGVNLVRNKSHVEG